MLFLTLYNLIEILDHLIEILDVVKLLPRRMIVNCFSLNSDNHDIKTMARQV